MITGINLPFQFDGREFHIQVEDLPDLDTLEVRVYVGGAILFQKRHGYEQAILGIEGERPKEEAIRDEMTKLVKLIQAAIQRGRIKHPEAT